MLNQEGVFRNACVVTQERPLFGERTIFGLRAVKDAREFDDPRNCKQEKIALTDGFLSALCSPDTWASHDWKSVMFSWHMGVSWLEERNQMERRQRGSLRQWEKSKRKSITQRTWNHWKKLYQLVFVLPLHQSQESQVPTAVSYYDDQDYKEVSYTKNQKPLEKALSTSVSASSSKERKPNKG